MELKNNHGIICSDFTSDNVIAVNSVHVGRKAVMIRFITTVELSYSTDYCILFFVLFSLNNIACKYFFKDGVLSHTYIMMGKKVSCLWITEAFIPVLNIFDGHCEKQLYPATLWHVGSESRLTHAANSVVYSPKVGIGNTEDILLDL